MVVIILYFGGKLIQQVSKIESNPKGLDLIGCVKALLHECLKCLNIGTFKALSSPPLGENNML